jgi:hypothetical protein
LANETQIQKTKTPKTEIKMGAKQKHYTPDGTLFKGKTHMMANGVLHSGATHTASSKVLKHFGQLSKKAQAKARTQWA